MIGAIRRFVRRMAAVDTTTQEISRHADRILFNQGLILARLNRLLPPETLADVEFGVYSQWGEDGILQHLVHNVPVKNKTFIEFGVEDFEEANCRFLMEANNWSGYVIDGSERKIDKLRASTGYWRHDLAAECSFITKDNISRLLDGSGFDVDLGVLSIDLDGMDYWIARELTHWQPRILVLEYNSVFGFERAVTVPYDPAFQRTQAHSSNLYWGASLKALHRLADRWGYGLVGTNVAGNNAFFVRRDLLNDVVAEIPLEVAFKASKYRESRNQAGKLSFISGDSRLDVIRGLPVWDVEAETMSAL